MALYKSCSECKQKCCQTGPGPYKKLSPTKYLEGFGTTDSYNTKCEYLMGSGRCKLWKTPKFPLECRIHICTSREFSKRELKLIDCVVETGSSYGCPKCKGTYVLYRNRMLVECELCGFSWRWARNPIKDK